MAVLLGVPFTPLITNIEEKQCGVLELSWEPSSFDSGGGPVKGFQVQIRKKNDDKWQNCTNCLPNNTCSFHGLLSQTDYHIRIRAVNQKGSSYWRRETVTAGVIGSL